MHLRGFHAGGNESQLSINVGEVKNDVSRYINRIRSDESFEDLSKPLVFYLYRFENVDGICN